MTVHLFTRIHSCKNVCCMIQYNAVEVDTLALFSRLLCYEKPKTDENNNKDKRTRIQNDEYRNMTLFTHKAMKVKSLTQKVGKTVFKHTMIRELIKGARKYLFFDCHHHLQYTYTDTYTHAHSTQYTHTYIRHYKHSYTHNALSFCIIFVKVRFCESQIQILTSSVYAFSSSSLVSFSLTFNRKLLLLILRCKWLITV